MFKKLLKYLGEKGNWRTLLFHSSWSLTFASGLSYFFGFLRDKIFAHEFGLSRSLDIYNAAFVVPDLLLAVLIGTAMSAAFVPIFTKQYDQKRTLGYQYAHQVMSWGFLLIIVVGILVAITLPLFAHKLVPGFEPDALKEYILVTRVLMLSPILFTFSNIYGRILMSVREFLWFGLAPAFYNAGILIGALVLEPHFGIVGLAMGAILGVLFHLLTRLIPLKQKKYHFKHKIDFTWSPEIKETLVLTAPKVLQYFMWHFMLLSFTRIASTLTEGSVAAYNYARNFQSIPVSLLGIAISIAMYTSLSHDAGRGNFKKFKSDFRRDRRRTFIYTTASAIALILLSKPLISLLLGGGRFSADDINFLSNVLKVYALAVPLESLLHIYHRAYYSIKNTWIPSAIHVVSIALAILLATQLAPLVGVFAIPIGFAGSLFLHVTVLSAVFPRVLAQKELDS